MVYPIGTMFSKLLETVTGKDDLERVASKENIDQLNAYLKTRTIWVPVMPTRFLDASSCTDQEIIDLVEKGAKDMAGDTFDLWVIEMDGKKVLPVFSSEKRVQAFSGRMSQDLNKIFSLGCIEVILEKVMKDLNVDSVILNPFCKKQWAVDVKKHCLSSPKS